MRKKLPMGKRVYSIGSGAKKAKLTPTAALIVDRMKEGPVTRADMISHLERELPKLNVKQAPTKVFAWWKKKLVSRGILKVQVAA